MTSLGFLTIRKEQEVSYFTEIAKASSHSITLFRFTPLDIKPGTEMVNGYQYDPSKGEWIKNEFPIPDYIYDRCFYRGNSLSKKSEPIVNWLKQRPGTTFLGYGLPNKWEVYTALSQLSEVSPYLPKTTLIDQFSSIKKALKQSSTVILKPVSGSQGNGIMKLQVITNSIVLHSQNKGEEILKTFHSAEEFKSYFQKLLQNTAFLCQPFFNFQIEDSPYDIRILLQKNKDGLWIEQGRGVRKGKKHGIVSNLHHGGEVLPFPFILNNWTKSKKLLVLEEIETIINQVPLHLEKKFGRIFELGLDIGVTDEGAVWLLDINSKPGRKVINHTFPNKKQDILEAPLKYCEFLHTNTINIRS
jgi:glutathione synthase/RimK-type ligase-like ATP-grasp enzyme